MKLTKLLTNPTKLDKSLCAGNVFVKSVDISAAKTNKTPSPLQIRDFQKKIYGYYRKYGRDLPWRKTRDPYHVLVSEIMLQQTQVDRVIPKYGEFIAAFPDFQSLHRASLHDVYAVWQGLGYNRRALSLKKIAEKAVVEFKGELPRSPEVLQTFPGIGKATAASICAFGFNQPSVFIETNIRTVFIHFYFPRKRMVKDPEIARLVELTLDKKHPCAWYSALMDYGTMLKKMHPNPSRRSAQYTRQSPFKGSRRQVRGALLKILLQKPNSTKKDIYKEFPENSSMILHEILEELIKEGLVKNNIGRFSIGG